MMFPAIIDFKARSRYRFLRFLSGLVSLPTQCYENTQKEKMVTWPMC